jgi:acetolactate synthase small subunit
MDTEVKSRIISLIVDNEFGVLARVVSLFSARGYNIEGLNVTEFDSVKKLSQITIETICNEKSAQMIIKLLERLIPVYTAKQLKEDATKLYFAIVKIEQSKLNEALNAKHLNQRDVIQNDGNYAFCKITTLCKEKLDQVLQNISFVSLVKSACIAIE